MEEIKGLLEKALEAREYSYAPYSQFQVGAAVLSTKGNVYTGCNIENASYGATLCGERTAICKGVSHGDTTFTAIAIVGGEAGAPPKSYCAPCGICRQVLTEFADPKTCQVILGITPEDYQVYTLEELLPFVSSPSTTGNPADSFLK